MKKISRFVASSVFVVSFCAPFLAAAQGINIGAIKPYSDSIIGIINSILVPVLMAIAFIVFLWGVFKYFILGAAEDKSREEGRQFVMWGIIGFVVILSVWGLVNVVISTLNLPGGNHPNPPQL